jgi:hypothetical protein
MDMLISMKYVLHVTTDVLNVKVLPLIVLNVPILLTDLNSTTVYVKLNTMMMVMLLHVMNVYLNVLNVLMPSDVLYVKLTENNPQFNVHVQKVNMNPMLPLLNVPPVKLDVTLVTQLNVMDVVLVPVTEKITLQPVNVKMVLMKTITEFANHVTSKDVKPVPEIHLVVLSVTLPELLLQKNVLVTMDIMKLKHMNV